MLHNQNNEAPLLLAQDNAKISVRVEVKYMEQQSRPENYVFSYRVFLQNIGTITAQVIARHWTISNAHAQTVQMHGLGVVGEQPVLQPGEKHEYVSSAAISTPAGSMRGNYLCITENAELFNAPIPEFTLSTPHALH